MAEELENKETEVQHELSASLKDSESSVDVEEVQDAGNNNGVAGENGDFEDDRGQRRRRKHHRESGSRSGSAASQDNANPHGGRDNGQHDTRRPAYGHRNRGEEGGEDDQRGHNRRRRSRSGEESSQSGEQNGGDRHRHRRQDNGGGYENHRGGRYEHRGGRGGYQGNRNYGDNQYNNMNANARGDGFVYPEATNKTFQSFKQFQALQQRQQGRNFDPSYKDKINNAYQKYTEEFQYENDKAFFDEHKHEPWFLEKYEPNERHTIWQEQCVRAQKLAKNFFENYDSRTVDLSAENPNIEQYKFDPNQRTVCFYKIPKWLSRGTLQKSINQKMEAPVGTSMIESISLSDPLKIYDYERYAFITFVNDALCELALKHLPGVLINDSYENNEGTKIDVEYKFAPVKTNIRSQECMVSPPIQNDQMKRDYDTCKTLIREILDKGKEIKHSYPFPNEQTTVDFMILYMRKVHGYCFYSGTRCEDERQLASKACPLYIRGIPSHNQTQEEFEAMMSFRDNYENAAKNVLHGGILKYENDLDEWLKMKKESYVQDNNQTINSSIEVYECKLCTKRFSSKEFISKHIAVKHLTDLSVFDKDIKAFKDEKSWHLYISDDNRINKQVIKNNQLEIEQKESEKAQRGGFGRGRGGFEDFNDRGGGRGGFNQRGGRGGGRGRGDRGGRGGGGRFGGNRDFNPDEDIGNKDLFAEKKEEYVDLDDPMRGTSKGNQVSNVLKKANEVDFDDLF